MNQVINFGSLNLDHVYRVPHLVRPGETLGSTDYRVFCGGKGGNQSIALARAGAAVLHAGRIGPDGGALVDNLRAAGIDTSLVEVGSEPTGHAVIQVDDAGQNAIILFSGANCAIPAAQLEAVLAAAHPGDLLLLQYEISRTAEIMTRAADAGLELAFNFAPFNPAAATELPLDRLRYLIVNETEGAGLTGHRDPAAILDELRRRYPATTAVLTLGPDGVMADDGRERLTLPAPPALVVDTTSAGDTFIGYFLAARLKEKTLARALEEGCAAAAVTVSRPGAAESIPFRHELNLD